MGIQGEVEKDHRMFLQACIFCLMKAQKIMNQSEIIKGVIYNASKQFAPLISLIIDQLVEKQYLKAVQEVNEE